MSNDALKSKLDDALGECEQLKTMCDAWRVRADLERDKVNPLRVENLALRSEIDRLQGELARLQAAVDAAKLAFEAHAEIRQVTNTQSEVRAAAKRFRDSASAFSSALSDLDTPRQAPAEGKGGMTLPKCTWEKRDSAELTTYALRHPGGDIVGYATKNRKAGWTGWTTQYPFRSGQFRSRKAIGEWLEQEQPECPTPNR